MGWLSLGGAIYRAPTVLIIHMYNFHTAIYSNISWRLKHICHKAKLSFRLKMAIASPIFDEEKHTFVTKLTFTFSSNCFLQNRPNFFVHPFIAHIMYQMQCIKEIRTNLSSFREGCPFKTVQNVVSERKNYFRHCFGKGCFGSCIAKVASAAAAAIYFTVFFKV